MAQRKGTRRTPTNFEIIQSLEVASGSKNTATQWLESHKKARAFLSDWVQMRESGETSAGIRQVHAYLREHFDYPFKSHQTLLTPAAAMLRAIAAS